MPGIDIQLYLLVGLCGLSVITTFLTINLLIACKEIKSVLLKMILGEKLSPSYMTDTNGEEDTGVLPYGNGAYTRDYSMTESFLDLEAYKREHGDL